MTTAQKKDWLGSQSFARVPESVLLDNRLGIRHLRLLCLLIMHADRHGIAWPGQDRLAEMLGDYNYPGTPEQTPNKNLVSKLISCSNPKAAPGLVQLGYVKKLGWIANRETQSYQIIIAPVPPEALNTPTSRKMSDAEYKVVREEKSVRLAEEAAVREAAKAAKKWAADVFVFEDETYHRNELHNAMLAGELDTYPLQVVVYFGYERDLL